MVLLGRWYGPLHNRGRGKVLLINKTNTPVVAALKGLRGTGVKIVDQRSAGEPIRIELASGETYTRGGFTVAIATLAG